MRLPSFALGDNSTVYLILLTEAFPDVQTKLTSHQGVLLSSEGVTRLTKSFWISGSKSKIPTPPALLDWKIVHQKMPWNIVFLLGGGFALAKGSEVTFLCLPGICLFLGCLPSRFSGVLSQNTRGHAGSTERAFPQVAAVGQTPPSLGGVLSLEQISVIAYAAGTVPPIKAA